jgi:long-chain acyl-CoA synthetase
LDNPVKTIGHFLTVGDNDIYLCGGVPFSHLGGLDYVLLMLYFGSTLVLIERFHPVEFLKSLAQYKVTIFCIVPAMYVAILSLKEYDVFDLSSLRYAVVFGAPSSPALLARFQKAYPGAKLLNGWGMTETSAPNTFSPDDVTKLASIGKFDFNMQAKLIDDQNKEAARGELLVKGEGVMMGYYKSEQLTAQILTGGWLKTGDIARRDSDGLYYLVGRKKDMLKVAGEIVFCAEVEEKIQMHPAVKEAAVIGVPDKLRGEVPRAFIVLKEGAMFGEAELLNFLKGNLAHFKIPHYFEFIKELPKNKTGKVDKAKLKEKAR